jgi:hypothetical protein
MSIITLLFFIQKKLVNNFSFKIYKRIMRKHTYRIDSDMNLTLHICQEISYLD